MTAFRASYADWKVIKTRACVQVVLEVPIEQADAAYQVLGGMPLASKEVWCGVARLTNGKEGDAPAGFSSVPKQPGAPPRLESNASDGADKERRKFETLPYSTQAGIRCNDPVFWAFLREMCAKDAGDVRDAEGAKQAVYKLCEVSSRTLITPGTEAEEYWLALNRWFETWQIKERVA